MRGPAGARVNAAAAGARARAGAEAFRAGGLEACLRELRAELAAAPAEDLPALTRALRYFHQTLLPEAAARAFGNVLLLDEDPRLARGSGGGDTPRLSALERERQELAAALAREEAREADLLRAAGEHDALSEEERALQDERRALERGLEESDVRRL